MICKICGTNNADGLVYCYACGATLMPYVNRVMPQQQQIPQQRVMPQQQQIPQQRVMPQQQYKPQQTQVKNNKKSHKGLIIGIILMLLLVAAAAVFFIFVMPKLSKDEPKGEYVNDDFGGSIMFVNGVYAIYDSDGGYEVGTYEVKGEEITFTTINGDVDHGKYNKKENTVEYGYEFSLRDADKGFGVEIDKDYIKSLKNKLKEAAETALGDEEVKAEAELFGADYYIYGSELVDKHTLFTAALSDNLNYESEAVLAYLLENNFITIDIYVNVSSKTAEVTVY